MPNISDQYTEEEDLFIVNRGNPAGYPIGTIVERTDLGWEKVQLAKKGKHSSEPYGYEGFILPYKLLDGCVLKLGGQVDERGLARPRIYLYP